MSVVTLQLGQCGNQVGQQFFEALSSEIRSVVSVSLVANSRSAARTLSGSSKDDCHTNIDATEVFFRTCKGDCLMRARAVMVDMEPKASLADH